MSLIQRALALLARGVLAGGLVAGAALAQPVGTAAGQVSQTISLQQARKIAREALGIGRPDIALQVAAQILAAHPGDVTAQIVLAAAQSRTGQPEAAAGTARLAYRGADTRAARYEAALLSAEALARAGRPLRAKLWLRTAQNHVTDLASGAAVAQAYRTVSAQTPFQFSLTLAGGPSSNINGGSLHDSFTFIGISIPITQALPGYAVGGSARVSYRLPGAAAREISLTVSQRSVWLSSEAKRLDPMARAGDYTFNELGLGYSARQVRAQGKMALSGSVQLGRRWQGGRLLGDVQRLDLGVMRQVGATRVAGVSLNVEAAQYPAKPVADAVQWTLGASLGQTGPAGGQLTYRVGYRLVASDAAGVAYRGLTASAEWRAPAWIDGIGFSFAAGVERREYWKAPTPNPDMKLRASMTASLQKLQRFGVVPEVTVTAARSRSDIVVRDTRDLGISFGFSSSF